MASPCLLSYEFSDLSLSVTEDENDKLDKKQNNVAANNDSMENESCCGENIDGPKFDLLLSRFWNEAQDQGLFRYPFKQVPSKVLPGKFGFLAQVFQCNGVSSTLLAASVFLELFYESPLSFAQYKLYLNTDRAEKRRAPEVIQSLKQPFNPNQFNFHKVKAGEIILQLSPWWEPRKTEVRVARVSHDENISSDHKIIINASPFEYGNVLLVPFISCNYQQLITSRGLRLAVEMLLLSRSRDFRVGFNSLCAYASVNHCHFHAYYLSHRLYIEHVELTQLAGPCYQLCNYPAAGFAFLMSELKDGGHVETFVAQVCKLTEFLQENNHPYNLYLTRGSSTGGKQFDALRLVVWARAPSCGSKTCDAFNPALCELAGHLPIKNPEIFQTITEDFVAEELRQVTSQVFNSIRDQVAALYCEDQSPR